MHMLFTTFMMILISHFCREKLHSNRYKAQSTVHLLQCTGVPQEHLKSLLHGWTIPFSVCHGEIIQVAVDVGNRQTVKQCALYIWVVYLNNAHSVTCVILLLYHRQCWDHITGPSLEVNVEYYLTLTFLCQDICSSVQSKQQQRSPRHPDDKL